MQAPNMMPMHTGVPTGMPVPQPGLPAHTGMTGMTGQMPGAMPMPTGGVPGVGGMPGSYPGYGAAGYGGYGGAYGAYGGGYGGYGYGPGYQPNLDYTFVSNLGWRNERRINGQASVIVLSCYRRLRDVGQAICQLSA